MCSKGAAGLARSRCEVADVFRLYGRDYRRSRRLPRSHLEVMRAVEACRTAELGGHIERCDACGFERPSYNSCRNRHCPKCQSLAKARWLAARRAELLPVGYFHAVFTLPHELNPTALANKRIVFDILFRSASETLREFGRDPRHRLGGKLGFTAILHTWDQRLRHHVHLHCLIAGGALSPDRGRWTHARKGFLFPVRALSKVFRGKFIDYLQQAHAAGRLRRGAGGAGGAAENLRALVGRLRSKPWVVYTKEPFAGPAKTLDYLGRYTHRVAISNHRITGVAAGAVTFTYRDRADGDRRKSETLAASEFIRRFLLHVLPKSYVRIRHFGFLAARAKGRDLARCRELLGVQPPAPQPDEKTARELMLELTGVDLAACPCCGRGAMSIVAELPRAPGPDVIAPPEAPDTS